jgi:replicative DNA helicase
MVLRAEDFFLDDHATVFRSILELHDRSEPVTSITLADTLSGLSRDKHKLQMTEALLGSVPHALDAVPHARIVQDKSRKRDLIVMAQKAIKECMDDHDPAAAIVERTESAIFSLSEKDASGETSEIVDAIDKAIARAEHREAGFYNGVTTGFTDLDTTIDGFRAGQLVILAARPGAGKTAIALNIGLHVSIEQNHPLLFVSLEMGEEELADRVLASLGHIEGHRIRNGMARTDREKAAKKWVRQQASTAVFGIDDTPTRSIGQIAANARRRARRKGLDLLIVDYIQLVDAQPMRNESRQEQVAKMSRRLKTLAKELNIPVLALSQLNRNSENREDRMPRLSDLRESGALEQDADVVLLLHRPDLYDVNDRPGEADLVIAKNRAGPTGTVKLTYRKEFTRFENYFPDDPRPVADAF